MTTSTVSASVDQTTKTIVNAYLKKAGTTPNELIRGLWESIAASGKIPAFGNPDEAKREARMKAVARIGELAGSVAHESPLASMSYNDIREELRDRDR